MLGAPGSGKSSLLRVLSGRQRATAGRVRFNGTPAEEGGARWARLASYLPQEDALEPLRTLTDDDVLTNARYANPFATR